MATPQGDKSPVLKTHDGQHTRKVAGTNWSSLGFFALSIALAILAVLLATGRVQIGGAPPPPPVQAGRANQIDVVNALRGKGLQADIDPDVSVRRGALDVPGQGLKVNGETAYLFLFADPAAAAAASAAPDAVLATVEPDAPDPFLATGSNVVIVMPGGDDASRALIAEALAGLPS